MNYATLPNHRSGHYWTRRACGNQQRVFGQLLVQAVLFALIILGIIAAVLVGWATRSRKRRR